MTSDSNTPISWPLLHGSAAPPPLAIPLRAGDLDMLYEAGALRLIRLGEVEVLRAIYMAVRDPDWLTVPGERLDERVVQLEDRFEVTYTCQYDWNGIRLQLHCEITGEANSLSFAMRGEALGTFRKNRIGLCVLHPIRECAGEDCLIEEIDGATVLRSFPNLISPHQPFRNVRAMRWRPAPDQEAALEFHGEIFETEDQRNWTDASFKTYGTPLDLPFPVTVYADDQFEQRVTLRLAATSLPRVVQRPEVTTFSPLSRPLLRLPRLGLGCLPELVEPSQSVSQYGAPVESLRALRLSHLRVDLALYDCGWSHTYAGAGREAALLNLPLELVLFFGPSPEHEWEALAEILMRHPAPIRSALLLQRGSKVTPPGLIEALAPPLRRLLPGVSIGGGTDAYFAEINRDRPTSHHLDFLSFSANPQVHAEDNRTLVENLSALSHVVQTARSFANGRAIHISPLTLRPRSNPDATSPPDNPLLEGLLTSVDPRQGSLLGAGWMLGSVKYLAEAGADSITINDAGCNPGVLRERDAVTPLYFVLREIWGSDQARIIPSASDYPLRVDGLILQTARCAKMVLANLTPHTQQVGARWVASRLRLLDESTAAACCIAPSSFDGGGVVLPDADGLITLSLPPFALAVLEGRSQAP